MSPIIPPPHDGPSRALDAIDRDRADTASRRAQYTFTSARAASSAVGAIMTPPPLIRMGTQLYLRTVHYIDYPYDTLAGFDLDTSRIPPEVFKKLKSLGLQPKDGIDANASLSDILSPTERVFLRGADYHGLDAIRSFDPSCPNILSATHTILLYEHEKEGEKHLALLALAYLLQMGFFRGLERTMLSSLQDVEKQSWQTPMVRRWLVDFLAVDAKKS